MLADLRRAVADGRGDRGAGRGAGRPALHRRQRGRRLVAPRLGPGAVRPKHRQGAALRDGAGLGRGDSGFRHAQLGLGAVVEADQRVSGWHRLVLANQNPAASPSMRAQARAMSPALAALLAGSRYRPACRHEPPPSSAAPAPAAEPAAEPAARAGARHGGAERRGRVGLLEGGHAAADGRGLRRSRRGAAPPCHACSAGKGPVA
jgi:hypothetical protein